MSQHLLAKVCGLSMIVTPLLVLSPVFLATSYWAHDSAGPNTSTEILGRILYAGGGPAGGAKVTLLPAAPPPESLTRTIAERVALELDAPRTITSQDGAFSFVVLHPIEYIIHASDPSGLQIITRVLTLREVESLDNLELFLTPPGSLKGRILSRHGPNYAGLRLWVRSIELHPLMAFVRINDHSQPIGPDGSFNIGSIPAGLAHVYLLLPSSLGEPGMILLSSTSPSHMELGTVNVPAGTTLEHNFELLEPPGSISVTVTRNGSPAGQVAVELYSASDPIGLALGGTTNASGCFGPVPVFAGTLTVRAFDINQGWSYRDADKLNISSGRQTECHIAVKTLEGTLLCLDKATNKRLGQEFVLISPLEYNPGGQLVFVKHRTDSYGYLSLFLVQGEYGCWLATDKDVLVLLEEVSPVVFTWNPQGLAAAEVRL